jgi:Resolvase, N terminal domain
MHEMEGQRALKGQSALKVGPRYVCGVWCVGMEANGAGEMIIAYARVSTDGQTLDAQYATLKAAEAERVFAEKASGAVTDPKALRAAWPR